MTSTNTTCDSRVDLLSLTKEELKALLLSVGEPAYRAQQLFTQLHRGLLPEQMTNIGKITRQKLAAIAYWHLPGIERKLVSEIDGTVKYLFSLADGNCVESVVMTYEHGHTICISSQVGCRMGCRFCASTIGGRVRDLSAGELLGQIIAAQADFGARIDNVVMMGIGEPLDNFDNVIKFLRLVNEEGGLNIGYRHISLSTCGIVDKIDALSALDLPITLSISLHAPDDQTRSAIMPVNNKWGVDALLGACRRYYERTQRRISFEYTLISGKNDTAEQAEKLARVLNSRLRGKERAGAMPIHVNLIPVNEVSETGFVRSGESAVRAFAKVLESRGIRATVRRKLGPDINASCGQLRRTAMREGGENLGTPSPAPT
ncbi:MAG: 23S rRNA (adenine(2503)-C(2))-methyltransferase RlmN [Clostridia bacterium]|nr:23S rRNA (adenine(2503)-C(2))-methyltransferase RlmN [Clostridia bacterium]